MIEQILIDIEIQILNLKSEAKEYIHDRDNPEAASDCLAKVRGLELAKEIINYHMITTL